MLMVLGVISDLFGIASIWGLSNESSLWERICITVFFLVIAMLMLFFSKDNYQAKIIDYCIEDESYTLFSKKNSNFKNDALVSIYRKEESKETLVAIGYVIVDESQKGFQVKVYRVINDRLFKKISFCVHIPLQRETNSA